MNEPRELRIEERVVLRWKTSAEGTRLGEDVNLSRDEAENLLDALGEVLGRDE